jgi:hypothetical protein
LPAAEAFSGPAVVGKRRRESWGPSLGAHQGGRDGGVTAGVVQRRPALVSRGGGVPVRFRPWREAEEVRLGSSRLPAGSIYSGCAPKRGIGDEQGGDRNCRAAAASLCSCAARVLACGDDGTAAQGRRAGRAAGGAGRARAAGALPFYGARASSPGGGGGHGQPARWAPPGRRGWAGRTGSSLRARPVRIGFFFFFFFFRNIFQCIRNSGKSPENTLKHEK